LTEEIKFQRSFELKNIQMKNTLVYKIFIYAFGYADSTAV